MTQVSAVIPDAHIVRDPESRSFVEASRLNAWVPGSLLTQRPGMTESRNVGYS